MLTLTDWEVGQMLIKWSDEMVDCQDFRESHPTVYRDIQKIRRELGDLFADLGSHSFGIYCNEVEGNGRSKKEK